MRQWYALAIAASASAIAGYGLLAGNRVAAAQGPMGTARIVAKVVLTGTPPPPTKLQMNADPFCAKAHQGQTVLSQTVEVGADGALKDAFVFVKDGAPGPYPAPSTPATINQKQCIYIPHLLGVMPGQPVEIINSEATLHNIHPMPVTNPAFNIGMPIQGMTQLRKFAKSEAPFPVKCDVHPWMSAYIGVFSNPFFGVSTDQGEELQNLPAGTFQVQAWQEKYGAQTQSVIVAAGETKQITFTFKTLRGS